MPTNSKEYMREYMRNYANPKLKEKVDCVYCECRIQRDSKWRHVQTIKHIQNVADAVGQMMVFGQ